MFKVVMAFTNVNKNGIVVLFHFMKANKGVDVEIHSFLTSALYCGGQSQPRPLYSGGRVSGTH